MRLPEWLGDLVELGDERLRLALAPSVGRAVHLSTGRGPNWFWINPQAIPPAQPWPSPGGDKFWPSAQFLWPQTHGHNGPEATFDKLPWSCSVRDDEVTLRSGASPHLGVQVCRRVGVDPASQVVVNSWEVVRRSPSKIPTQVWTVSSCLLGDDIWMDGDGPGASRRSGPIHSFGGKLQPGAVEAVGDGNWRFQWPESGSAKIGTYGRWVALRRGREAFLQVVAVDPDGCYLEESSVQAWCAPASGFCEIETCSPSFLLREGEVFSWTVLWRMVELPDEADPAGISAFLSAAAQALASRLGNPRGLRPKPSLPFRKGIPARKGEGRP